MRKPVVAVLLSTLAWFALVSSSFSGSQSEPAKAASSTEEKVALELFSFESTYTAGAMFKQGGMGSQDAVYNSFSYGHRFALFSNWYLRAGLEYERYDFGTSRAPVPGTLQNFSGTLAVEYVVEGYAGAALEIHPGFYFEHETSARAFDIPFDLFVTIPIRKKIYGVIGAAGAQFYRYPVIPIGGVIWLIAGEGKVRLEAVFPKVSFVYNKGADWEFRVLGEVYGGGYRTDRIHSDPRLRGAILEYDEYRLGGQVTWSHFKPFDVVVGVGYTFGRSFDFHRANETFDTQGATYFKFGIDAEF